MKGVTVCHCGWKLPVNIYIQQTVSSDSEVPVKVSITKASVQYDCPKCGTGLSAEVPDEQVS